MVENGEESSDEGDTCDSEPGKEFGRSGVAVAAGVYGRGEDGLNFAVETV